MTKHTQDQIRRIKNSITETRERHSKVYAKKTFDQTQEIDKQREMDFLASHIVRLQNMLLSE
jgi:hypothetical protein